MTSESNKLLGKETVIGHPSGLFILFFTEMWERFSYYGMRALLVLFLVSSVGLGGWEWSNQEALSLYATYTGLVYVTPIFGGLIADKLLGFRNAVIIGALLMTLGHASMAFETELTFYVGLALLILGNGFFKPNISSIVGGLYKDNEKKKDAGYTIFYMGINAGAFLGILLCGYIGEKEGWSYGFGLAGIFMFIGMLQFWFAKGIFGKNGDKPSQEKLSIKQILNSIKERKSENKEIENQFDETKYLSKIEKEIPNAENEDKKSVLQELKERFVKKISNDRLIVIAVLAFFTIFFWMAFEQAGGSMTIFAKDFTNRVLTGGAAKTFNVINTIITIVPLAIITWVLVKLFQSTFKKYALSNIFLGFGFVIIWGIAIWMLNKEFNTKAFDISYSYDKTVGYNDTVKTTELLTIGSLTNYLSINEKLNNLKTINGIGVLKTDTNHIYTGSYIKNVNSSSRIRTDDDLKVGDVINLVQMKDDFKYISDEKAKNIKQKVKAEVVSIVENEVKVPASWFGVLNSLFIILFAPLFSKIWESRYNPSAPIKFALGLILLGIGFGVLAFGAKDIVGEKTIEVSMIWLILAYLFHTLGELALSPVGLSYVSKLSPAKLVSMMFGIWFTATAVANYLAGKTGSMIDQITKEHSLSYFFLIFTFLPIFAGLILVALNKWLKQKMHGIE